MHRFRNVKALVVTTSALVLIAVVATLTAQPATATTSPSTVSIKFSRNCVSNTATTYPGWGLVRVVGYANTGIANEPLDFGIDSPSAYFGGAMQQGTTNYAGTISFDGYTATESGYSTSFGGAFFTPGAFNGSWAMWDESNGRLLASVPVSLPSCYRLTVKSTPHFNHFTAKVQPAEAGFTVRLYRYRSGKRVYLATAKTGRNGLATFVRRRTRSRVRYEAIAVAPKYSTQTAWTNQIWAP